MTNRIDQPQALDLVGNPIFVAGVGTGFEATLNYRVHEGHDEVTGFFTVGGRNRRARPVSAPDRRLRGGVHA